MNLTVQLSDEEGKLGSLTKQMDSMKMDVQKKRQAFDQKRETFD